MRDRSGRTNYERFPVRRISKGQYLCRVCGKRIEGRGRSFCSRRCSRDFAMLTDWRRVRRVVFERDGGICMICGRELYKDRHMVCDFGVMRWEPIIPWHIDHIIPIAAGGAEWDLNNLQLLCAECNLRKGDKEAAPCREK